MNLCRVNYAARRLRSVYAALLRGGLPKPCGRFWSPFVRENRGYSCVYVCVVEMFVSLFLQMNYSDTKIRKHRWTNKINLFRMLDERYLLQNVFISVVVFKIIDIAFELNKFHAVTRKIFLEF